MDKNKLREVRKYLSKEDKEALAKDFNLSIYTIRDLLLGYRVNVKVITRALEMANENKKTMQKLIKQL